MIDKFLDNNGKIKAWPRKFDNKKAILEYLSTKFENKIYTEKEVMEIINNYHTFNDPLLLRRSLIDYKYLKRTKDGREYKK